MMKQSRLYIILNALGILLSVLPPLIATLSYFPLWRTRGAGAVISGGVLVLLLLASVPLLRIISARLKSPSAPIMWLFIFLFFSVMAEIADELTVISFFGLLGNALGALLFRLARAKK